MLCNGVAVPYGELGCRTESCKVTVTWTLKDFDFKKTDSMNNPFEFALWSSTPNMVETGSIHFL